MSKALRITGTSKALGRLKREIIASKMVQRKISVASPIIENEQVLVRELLDAPTSVKMEGSGSSQKVIWHRGDVPRLQPDGAVLVCA